MVKVEVCAESVKAAITARQGGAYRVEFCYNLAEGGTTQLREQIAEARKQLPEIKLYPIIRPRGGDFFYSALEYETMRQDVIFCGEVGCDGVVFGILNSDRSVDMDRCSILVGLAHRYGMEATFHRAFDVCSDRTKALEDIISIGFERILTSGGQSTALEGVEELRKLIVQANDRIVVMPGSGVTPENVGEIITKTGCREIHGTFRNRCSAMKTTKPAWNHYDLWHTDIDKVKNVVNIAKQF